MKISSSNSYFENLMSWAQEKTKQFIMTDKTGPINVGDGNKWYGPSGRFSNKSKKTRKQNKPWTKDQKYIPSYWAGYYDRTAFYIRDFVHQIPGAAFLGYNEENYQMMYNFVKYASKETGWYAPWALNFDGSVYYLDTPNYKRFVRELTGQYEMVEAISNLYFLTGDERYLDSVFLEYCEHILNDFTNDRDGIVLSEKNGVPEGAGNLWKGSVSYNEGGVSYAESADCIATVYSAMSAYSRLLKIIGSDEKSDDYRKRAEALKRYFNDEWSVVPESNAYAFGIDKNGKKYWNWTKSVRGIIGAETMFFIPIKLLSEPGERNDALLDKIDKRAKDSKTCMPNIESYTYLPQVFFPYHRAENAWYWMKYIGDRVEKKHVKASQGLNGDYPEISFTLISAALQGILGVSVDAVTNMISTCPCLPKEIHDVSAENVSIGGCEFDIAFTDAQTAEFTNRSDKEMLWKCVFTENVARMNVDGNETECKQEIVNGVLRSFVEIVVKPNTKIKVE